MFPIPSRGLIISGVFFLICVFGVIDDNVKGKPDANGFVALIAVGCFVLWYGIKYIRVVRAVTAKRTLIKQNPQLMTGEHFISVDGRCAIAMNPKTMQVALIDAQNRIALCQPGDIISCELEIDKKDGTELRGRAWWLSFFGGFSASEVEEDWVKSVTMRVLADNMEVPSVNLFFLKNTRHRKMRGNYADAMDIATRWEDKMTVFTGDFDMESNTATHLTNDRRDKTIWKKTNRR